MSERNKENTSQCSITVPLRITVSLGDVASTPRPGQRKFVRLDEPKIARKKASSTLAPVSTPVTEWTWVKGENPGLRHGSTIAHRWIRQTEKFRGLSGRTKEKGAGHAQTDSQHVSAAHRFLASVSTTSTLERHIRQKKGRSARRLSQ